MNQEAINLSAEAFSPEHASTYLRTVWGLTYAPTTLGKFRSIGGGPSFHRVGNNGPVIYTRRSLDNWVEQRIGTALSNVTQERALGKQPPPGRDLTDFAGSKHKHEAHN